MSDTLADVKHTFYKCDTFSGIDAEWLGWKSKFEAWLTLALCDTGPDAAEKLTRATSPLPPSIRVCPPVRTRMLRAPSSHIRR